MFFFECRIPKLITCMNLLLLFMVTGCSLKVEKASGTEYETSTLKNIETLGLRSPESLFENKGFRSIRYQTAPDERWVRYTSTTGKSTNKKYIGHFLNGKCFTVSLISHQPTLTRSEALDVIKAWLPESNLKIDETDSHELEIQSLKSPTEYFYFGTKYSALINFARTEDGLKVSDITLSKIKEPRAIDKKELAQK